MGFLDSIIPENVEGNFNNTNTDRSLPNAPEMPAEVPLHRLQPKSNAAGDFLQQMSRTPADMGTMLSPMEFDAERENIARYEDSEYFKSLGYDPRIDNESKYGRRQTIGDTYQQAFAGAGSLAWNTFVEGWKGWGNLASAIYNWDASKIMGDPEELAEIDKAQKAIFDKYAIYTNPDNVDGIFNRQFLGNMIQQSGFSLGTIAQFATEELLTMGLGAALKPLTGARSLKNIARAGMTQGEIIADIKKLTDVPWKSSTTMQKMYKTLNAAGEYTPGVGGLFKTGADVMKLGKMGATKAEKIGVTLNGLRRTFSEANMSFGEARMESAGTYVELKESLMNKYRDADGNISASREQEIEKMAQDGAWSNFKANTAVLMVMNRLQFDNLFSKFDAGKKIMRTLASEGENVMSVTGKAVKDKIVTNTLDKGKDITVKAGQKFSQVYKKGLTGTFGNLGKIADDFGKGTAAWEASKSIFKNLMKFEGSEGVQELIQTGSNTAVQDYYTDLFDDEVNAFQGSKYQQKADLEKSLTKGATDQMNIEGGKTFLMGALTGRLLSPINFAAGKISDRMFTNKAQRDAREESIDMSIDTLNSYFADPYRYAPVAVANLKANNKAAAIMQAALADNDQYVYENAKDSAFASIITSAKQLNMFESLVDTVGAYGEHFNESEFKEAFGIDFNNDNRQTVKEYMSRMASDIKKFSKRYDELKEEFSDFVQPEKYGAEDQDKMRLVQRSLDEAISWIASNEYKAKRTAERGLKIIEQASKVESVSKTSHLAFRILGDSLQHDAEIKLLENEIENSKGATETPEMKELLERKQKQLEILLQAKTNIAAFEALTETDPKVIDDLMKSISDFLNAKNEEFDVKTTVSDKDANDIFYRLTDYRKLQADEKNFLDAYNLLTSPKKFLGVHARIQEGLESLRDKKIAAVKSALAKKSKAAKSTKDDEDALSKTEAGFDPFADEEDDPSSPPPKAGGTASSMRDPFADEDDSTETYSDIVDDRDEAEIAAEEALGMPPEMSEDELSDTDFRNAGKEFEVDKDGNAVTIATLKATANPVTTSAPVATAAPIVSDPVTRNRIPLTRAQKNELKEEAKAAFEKETSAMRAASDEDEVTDILYAAEEKYNKRIQEIDEWPEEPSDENDETNQGGDEPPPSPVTPAPVVPTSLADTKQGQAGSSEIKLVTSVVIGTQKINIGDAIVSKNNTTVPEVITGIKKNSKGETFVEVLQGQTTKYYTIPQLGNLIKTGKYNFLDAAIVISNSPANIQIKDGDVANRGSQDGVIINQGKTFAQLNEEASREIKMLEEGDTNRKMVSALTIASRSLNFETVGDKKVKLGDNDTYETLLASSDLKINHPIYFKIDDSQDEWDDIVDFETRDASNNFGVVKRKRSEIFSGNRVKDSMSGEVPIAIYTMYNGEEVKLGYLSTLKRIDAVYKKDGPKQGLRINIVGAIKQNGTIINNHEIQRDELLKLRNKVVAHYHANGLKTSVKGNIVNMSNGTLRTRSGATANQKMKPLSESVSPDIQLGVVISDTLMMDRDTPLDIPAEKLIHTSPTIKNKNGWVAALIPTKRGEHLVSYVKADTLNTKDVDVVVELYKAFWNVKNNGAKASDEAIKGVSMVYEALGIPAFEKGDLINFSFLTQYVNNYIAFLDSRSYDPLLPAGTNQFNITADGEISFWSVNTQDVKKDSVYAKNLNDFEKYGIEKILRSGLSKVYYNTKLTKGSAQGINSIKPLKFIEVNNGKFSQTEPMTYNQMKFNHLLTNIEGRKPDGKSKTNQWVYFDDPISTFSFVDEPIEKIDIVQTSTKSPMETKDMSLSEWENTLTSEGLEFMADSFDTSTGKPGISMAQAHPKYDITRGGVWLNNDNKLVYESGRDEETELTVQEKEIFRKMFNIASAFEKTYIILKQRLSEVAENVGSSISADNLMIKAAKSNPKRLKELGLVDAEINFLKKSDDFSKYGQLFQRELWSNYSYAEMFGDKRRDATGKENGLTYQEKYEQSDGYELINYYDKLTNVQSTKKPTSVTASGITEEQLVPVTNLEQFDDPGFFDDLMAGYNALGADVNSIIPEHRTPADDPKKNSANSITTIIDEQDFERKCG